MTWAAVAESPMVLGAQAWGWWGRVENVLESGRVVQEPPSDNFSLLLFGSSVLSGGQDESCVVATRPRGHLRETLSIRGAHQGRRLGLLGTAVGAGSRTGSLQASRVGRV